MPSVALVVCVYKERDLFERLLKESADCYDDLVVVHDGPEDGEQLGSIEQIVVQHRGRFFVGSRSFQQEPHWPSAWTQARHNWILRLDADEVPTEDLKSWLRSFREAGEPDVSISGYTCVWPLWNGKRTVTRHWPAGRIFLFHKERVRFFGMAEQVPVPDGRFEALPLVLEHRPDRKSYGFANLLLRPQAYRWRRIIAHSLLRKPTDLPCWRWTNEAWPQVWQEIRTRPLRTGFYRLLVWPYFTLRDTWHAERRIILPAAISGGINHCLIALEHWRLKCFRSRI